jgi:phenylalanyl-tRNA synthetase beta chain
VAIGIYDASDIAFPIQYAAADPDAARFVPLGMETELTLRDILSEHPTGETYAHLLEDMDKYPLITDSMGKVLSMPPVINSRNPGAVEVGDTFLFCEATGTELDAVLLSVSIMAANMADRGGRILPVNTIYPYDTPRGREIQCPLDMTESVEVELDDLRRVIGGGIDNGSVEGALAAMGYRDIVLGRTRVRARPAPYRDDILHPVDLIEDVIVAVGFDNFEPEMPHDFTVGKSAPDEDLADRIRGLMVGCGFQELFLPILSSSVDLTERMRAADAAIVEISNPMSENYSAVRNALLPGLLRVEGASRKALYPHHVFEVGEVSVIAPDDLYGTRTEIRLSALEAHAEANLSGIQSHLEALAYYLGFDYSLTPWEHPTFLPGRAGEIRVDGKSYGIIGEFHPEVLENWGISVPASAFEVNIDIARIQP